MKEISDQISITLRRLRSERGWSLDKTSKNTGVSKAMLGQIERGESSPTIATLWKIAKGFQAPFSAFIEDTQPNTLNIAHRTGTPQFLHPADDKIKVMPIFPFDSQLGFEVFTIELMSGCEHLSPGHDEGVIEHIIVVEGVMDVFANGEWHTLKQGEGLRFDAHQKHGYRNTSSNLAIIHDMIHYCA